MYGLDRHDVRLQFSQCTSLVSTMYDLGSDVLRSRGSGSHDLSSPAFDEFRRNKPSMEGEDEDEDEDESNSEDEDKDMDVDFHLPMTPDFHFLPGSLLAKSHKAYKAVVRRSDKVNTKYNKKVGKRRPGPKHFPQHRNFSPKCHHRLAQAAGRAMRGNLAHATARTNFNLKWGYDLRAQSVKTLATHKEEAERALWVARKFGRWELAHQLLSRPYTANVPNLLDELYLEQMKDKVPRFRGHA